MIQVFSQLLSAALGSVGFGLIFNLNRRYLPAAGVGGLLAWLAYLLAANTLHSVFLANLLAGFCAALYAEILARCCNAPSTPKSLRAFRIYCHRKTAAILAPRTLLPWKRTPFM